MSKLVKENLTEKCMTIRPSLAIMVMICLTIISIVYIIKVEYGKVLVELKAKDIELKAKEIELKAKEVEALIVSRTETKDSFVVCVQTLGQNVKDATTKEVQEACKEFKKKVN